jgi:hypothetical protein
MMCPAIGGRSYATPNSFQQLFLEAGLSENLEIKFLEKPFNINQFLKAVDDLRKSRRA